MSILPHALHGLLDAVRDYVTHHAPGLRAFCGELLDTGFGERELKAATLPVAGRLPDLREMTTPNLASILEAAIDAAPHLCWRQSYVPGDPGIDAHYLAHYGWFNLIAPSGPFVCDDLRLSFGYWGRGLAYPRHWHEPEEIYLTIAGAAVIASDGRAAVRAGPGEIVHHHPNQPHALAFPEAPFFAAAFWRGAGLERKSALDGA